MRPGKGEVEGAPNATQNAFGAGAGTQAQLRGLETPPRKGWRPPREGCLLAPHQTDVHGTDRAAQSSFCRRRFLLRPPKAAGASQRGQRERWASQGEARAYPNWGERPGHALSALGSQHPPPQRGDPSTRLAVEPRLVQTKGELGFRGKTDRPYLFWGLSRQQTLVFLGTSYQLHLQRPGSGKSKTTVTTQKNPTPKKPQTKTPTHEQEVTRKQTRSRADVNSADCIFFWHRVLISPLERSDPTSLLPQASCRQPRILYPRRK